MKNIFKILFFFCSVQLVLLFSACTNYEPFPLEWNTEDRVMNPADSTENSAIQQLFYACYLDLPNLHNRFKESYLDAATDDGVPTRNEAGSGDLNNYRNGLLNPGIIANLDGDAWKRNYRGIRRVNLFLEKLPIFPPSTQVNEARMKQMKAEARFLRAFYYFELMKRWGGVPMVGDAVLNAEDDCNIPRSSIEDVAAYIINEISPDVEGSCYQDLHAAQSSGEYDPTEIGHVNQGAALALLSRLKLYLASPLYNPENDLEKWKEAAAAAKELIDKKVYSLFNSPPASMYKLFAISNAADFPHPEMIMIKQGGTGTDIEQKNSPSGYSFTTGTSKTVVAEGRTSPSQNLVDAFLTLDGKSIYVDYDPAKGYIPEYNDQDPYTNRDPRLQRTVFVNGSRWLQREVQTFEGGSDRRDRSSAYTRTGYYLKKFLGNNEEAETYQSSYHHYQIFRYAEILLNYAEAVNEFDPGNDKEIRSGIIELRKRAGISEGLNKRYGLPETYSQDLMRRIIRNERRIELAFEEHRFWDIRRWKICSEGDAVMQQPVRGVKITKQSDGSLLYTYEDVAESKFDGNYMYWYPIPRNELYGNTELKQNEGWGY